MAPIKTAVLGYGLSAKIFHIPFILSLPQHFTLHSILQRTPAPTNNASTDHPNIKIFTDATTMLADPDIDLLIITSIPNSHYDLCTRALKANKHVLCEKPFVPSSAQALELHALAQSHGKILSVYQNRRFDADFLLLSRIIAEGKLGRIAEFESHFDRHRPYAPKDAGSVSWKAKADDCAGAIWDLGSHLLDQFVCLFGIPERVTGFVGNQRVYDVPGTGGEAGGDSFTVLLHYDSRRMLGTAKAGVVSPEVEQSRFWVRGTEGSLRKCHLDPQEEQLKEGGRPWGEGGLFGVEAEERAASLTKVDPKTGELVVRRVGQEVPPRTYKAFYEALAGAIRGNGENPVSADDNARVLKVIEAAIQSSEEGRTVSLGQ